MHRGPAGCYAIPVVRGLRNPHGVTFLGPSHGGRPADGHGVILYPWVEAYSNCTTHSSDGTVYVGGIEREMRHGYGTFFDWLSIYEGSWNDDFRHGEGCFSRRNSLHAGSATTFTKRGEWNMGRLTRLQRFDATTGTSWRDTYDFGGSLASTRLEDVPDITTPSSATDVEECAQELPDSTATTASLGDGPQLGVMLKVSGYSELGSVVDRVAFGSDQSTSINTLLPTLKRNYLSSSDLQSQIPQQTEIPLEYRDLSYCYIRADEISLVRPVSVILLRVLSYVLMPAFIYRHTHYFVYSLILVIVVLAAPRMFTWLYGTALRLSSGCISVFCWTLDDG